MTTPTKSDEFAQIAQEKFDKLATLDGGPELLNEHKQTFQFIISGIESGAFVVDVRDGEATVSVGVADNPPGPVSTVETDAKTMYEILTGETAIVDEVWNQNAEANIYGGKMEDTSWLSRMLKRIRNSEGKYIPRTSHTYYK